MYAAICRQAGQGAGQGRGEKIVGRSSWARYVKSLKIQTRRWKSFMASTLRYST